ncbi:MAG: glycosyltransferase [Bacteroidota bacterium]|nr:glycosyltransferase [Bacteroidota bacterium]
MRICLVSSSFYPAKVYGGPVFSTWGLSKKLSEHGHEIFVSTTNANGLERLINVSTKEHKEIYKNIWVRYYKEEILNFFSASLLFNIWRDIKNSDIIYVQYLFHYTVVVALFFAWFFKKQIIICPRGSFSHYTLTYNKSFLKQMWLFFIIRPFHKFIKWHASSELEKNDIISYFPQSKIIIVQDGIDIKKFKNKSQLRRVDLIKYFTNRDFDEVEEVICSIGRLHKIKCFHILIDAFSVYLKENTRSKLIIAGSDDGQKKTLENQILTLELSDSVFLIGEVNEIDKQLMLYNSDFFALASEFESFGIVVAESLACGLPVLVSNKTPWKEIERYNCGILVNNNKEDFYLGLLRMKNTQFNKHNCINYSKENFDWEIIANRFIKSFIK